ncbi:MAG TPA: FkbM family methyltransferase [Thermoanaerobaculia bacterium]|nr:FkbM family methyltransferase [Thermoanaerobaculia bacterium]
MKERFFKPHYLFRPSQAARRFFQALRRTAPESATVKLPWGLHLRIDPRESIGSAVWRLGLYDLAVSEALWRLTSPGDLTVDVGANLGHMAGILALRAGPAGRVLAFEPHPGVFADLAENVRLAATDPRTAPIEAFPLAVGDAEGMGNLDCGDGFALNRGLARLAASESAGIPVRITTIDVALGGRTAGVVKVDVEGATQAVIAGARDSLREGRIRHLVYEAHEDERELLASSLRDSGYSIFALGRDRFGLILGGDREAPSLPGYEAPSCLATRDPSHVHSVFGQRGWRVFS